jgi:hypothetical protein
MKQSFILRLENIFGEIVSEDELNLEEGDILLCKINANVELEAFHSISKTIHQCFENKTGYLIFPEFIDIKILKVEKGE